MKTVSKLLIGLISLFSLLCLAGKSQTQKGDLLLEGRIGNFNVGRSTTEYPNIPSFNYEHEFYSLVLNPQAGFFLNPKMVLGASLSFLNGITKDYTYTNGVLTYVNKNTNLTLGLMPFFRYYFVGMGTKNLWYTQLGFGVFTDLFYQNEQRRYDNFGKLISSSITNYNNNGLSAEILLGFNHFFTPSLAFNSTLGYNFSIRNSTNAQGTIIFTPSKEVNSRITTDRLVWNFGFTLILPKKQASPSTTAAPQP